MYASVKLGLLYYKKYRGSAWARGSRMTEPGADAGPTGRPQAASACSRAAWVLCDPVAALQNTPRRSPDKPRSDMSLSPAVRRRSRSTGFLPRLVLLFARTVDVDAEDPTHGRDRRRPPPSSSGQPHSARTPCRWARGPAAAAGTSGRSRAADARPRWRAVAAPRLPCDAGGGTACRSCRAARAAAAVLAGAEREVLAHAALDAVADVADVVLPGLLEHLLALPTSSRRSSPSLMRSIFCSRVAVISLDEMSTGAFSMAASKAAMSAMPSSARPGCRARSCGRRGAG